MPVHDDVQAVAVPGFYGKSRFRVGEPLPPVLTVREVGLILGYAHSRTWQLKKAGAFDIFEIHPRIGTSARYSGRKVEQWFSGELDIQRGRFFGSRRGNR